MEHFYQLGWTLENLSGPSGAAYKAEQDGTKLFLKRNSSPLLLALSTEGIVPKLLWTKRIETGEVVTAQHWENGRELNREEMETAMVAQLLCKIHSSNRLLTMLKKLGIEKIRPEILLHRIQHSLSPKINAHGTIHEAIKYLENEVPSICESDCVVSHGDVNHHNWLLSDQGELFLVDWEGAMIADRAIDLSMLLYKYIKRDSWEEWLGHYGIELNHDLRKRMKWYALVQGITMVQWYEDNKRFQDMNEWIKFVDNILKTDKFI